MWTAPESPTPTPLASWSSGAVIDCYVTNDKCKLYDLINIRSSWRVLIPDKLSGGWLFKLKNGTQINVTNYGNNLYDTWDEWSVLLHPIRRYK
jgi:hypothetical protein